MSSNLVIVAIPDENDRVWKISSEKTPHLTVLFLDEVDNVANLDQIMLFVEHAADMTLRRFWLPVDRRGELGADKADVLFFKKNRYDFKAVRDFRSLLLKDPNIKTAYDSTRQFETPEEVGASGQPWIPHLTLGYPETPAKKLDEQDFGFYSVDFNKIAVWTGDFEGPDFLLKDYGEEFDEMAIPMDVAMSDIQHFGVKGMHWGVRKQETAEGGHIRISNKSNRALPSGKVTAGFLGVAVVMLPLTPAVFLSPRVRAEFKAARTHNDKVRADKKWKKQIDKSKQDVKVHNTAADEINSKISTFNNDKRWKDIDLTKDSAKQKAYDDAALKELLNPAYANASVKVYGSESPSGRYKFEINDSSTATLKLRDTLRENQAKHADEDDEAIEIRFKINRDSNGHITGFIPKENAMAQTADLGVKFLEHVGVKGMRWGVRNEKIRALNTRRADRKFEKKAKSGGTMIEIFNQGSKLYREQDIDRINAKPEYANANFAPAHSVGGQKRPAGKDRGTKLEKQYLDEHYNTLHKRINEVANAQTNRSGTKRYAWKDYPNAKWYGVKRDLVTEDVEHADTDKITVELVRDEKGKITDMKLSTDTLTQGEEFVEGLIHFGIKGMRWGVRNERSVATDIHTDTGIVRRRTKVRTKGGEAQPAHEDAVKAAIQKQKLKKSGTDALSNGELKQLASRLELEVRVETLATKKGRKFISRQLETQGQQQLQKGISRGVATGAGRVAKKGGKAAGTAALLA